MSSTDVAIVGGGIAGLLAAIRVGRSGARVLVLDARRGTPQGTPCCGILSAEAFQPYAARAGAYGRRNAAAIRAAAIRGRLHFGETARSLPLVRVPRDASEGKLLEASSRMLREDGFDPEPDAAFLDPAEGIAALRRSAVDAGVEIRSGAEVRDVRPRPDLEFDLALRGGERVRAVRVVLVLGARLARIDPLGQEVVTPLRVPWVRLDAPPPPEAPRALLADGGAIRAVFSPTGSVLAAGLARAPAKRDFATSSRLDPADRDALILRLESLAPWIRGASLVASGAEPIGLPCDGLPVIGEHPRRPGILLASGFGADEGALAAFAGDALGTTILEGRAEIPEALSPRRMR